MLTVCLLEVRASLVERGRQSSASLGELGSSRRIFFTATN